MKKIDIFGDEIVEKGKGGSFEQAFLSSKSNPKVGDKIRGEIVSINKDEVFVSLSGPLDAQVSKRDFLDSNGELTIKLGDLVDLQVTQIREEVIKARSVNSLNSSGDLESLEDAFDMEIPVEGKVIEITKGGLKVQIQNYRAFCPISQIQIGPAGDLNEFLDKKFEFLITELDQNHRNIVVSRRKLMELQRASEEGEFVNKVKVGDLLEGVVTRLEKFGAFVEVAPMVEGLVHISEISWVRIKSPRDVLEVGMPVRVRVMKIEETDQRLNISLSIKEGGGELDPWTQFTSEYKIGDKFEGTIRKKEVFGYFIELSNHITGLLHQSKWKESVQIREIESKKVGDKIWVEIDKIDSEAHKISLTLPGGGEDQSWRDHMEKGSNSAQGLGAFAQAFGNALNKK